MRFSVLAYNVRLQRNDPGNCPQQAQEDLAIQQKAIVIRKWFENYVHRIETEAM